MASTALAVMIRVAHLHAGSGVGVEVRHGTGKPSRAIALAHERAVRDLAGVPYTVSVVTRKDAS
jgi:hypothetical protein